MKKVIFIVLLCCWFNPAFATDVCNCKGYAGVGGPCYAGEGGSGKTCPNICK